jgi:hypothetical protein
MNCQRARDVFPELLDSRTAATAHLDARTHLASCPDCQREFAALSQTATALDAMPTTQPSPRLRQNFYAMLEEEKHSAVSVRAVAEREYRSRRASLWAWVLSPLVAAALLVLGFALGKRAVPEASSTTPGDESMKRVIASLETTITRQGKQLEQQNAQIEKMTTLVGYSILQQQQNPANERLQGILAKAKDATPTDKDIDAIIQALTLDPSANVRLRAIEALYPHAEREVVRAGVVAALPREQNPLVQLELIDFVAAAQDRNASPILEKLAADESTNISVRDAAKLALAQL